MLEKITPTGTIVQKELKPIAIVSDKQIDQLLEQYQDMRDGQFTAWHAGIIKKLGTSRYCQLASTAKQEGKSPQRYFTWLIQKEIMKLT